MTVRGFVGASRSWEVLWVLVGPIRWVIAHFPTRKGRGRLTLILDRILSGPSGRPSTVILGVPAGGQVHIGGATGMVRSAIARGQFEAAELALLSRLCRPGSVAFDVGANVGLFSVALAQAVGPTGRVVAIEPYPESIEHLIENLRRNAIDNVVVVPMAVGATTGTGRFIPSLDPALIQVEATAAEAGSTVAIATLDDLWRDLGSPSVSVLKIDVEGSEVGVLRGATALLATGPALMVETHATEYPETVGLLRSLGYEHQVAPLEPWNHLFRFDAERSGTPVADDAG